MNLSAQYLREGNKVIKTKSMKTLVIGYGSIGMRHTRILKELSCPVSVLSRRKIDFQPCYSVLDAAIQNEQFDLIVIANETAKHYELFCKLVENNFRGLVLIEKPAFSTVEAIPENSFQGVYVAYNLRFHPIIQKLREVLENEKIVSVQAYVGKYLPEWRPKANYRNSYSARQQAGGGVLRDLSHELDYLNWILGGWKSITALGGHLSHLEIDSDDVFSVMMTTARCPIVTVQMNYVDRVSHREILINTQQHTIKADLIKGILQIDGITKSFDLDKDLTYRNQHFAILNGNFDLLCSLEEGIEVLKMIEAAEQAATAQVWVKR